MDLVTDETSLAIASQKKMTSTEGRLILRGRFTNLVCRIHDVRERRAFTGSTIEGSSFFGCDRSGYRPHPHWGRRKRTHQVTRIGFIAQPADEVDGREDKRHAVMDFSHHFVGICRDHREVRIHRQM